MNSDKKVNQDSLSQTMIGSVGELSHTEISEVFLTLGLVLQTELAMQTSTSALASSDRQEADRAQDVHCTMGQPNGVIMDLICAFSARQTAFICPKTKSFFCPRVFNVSRSTLCCFPEVAYSPVLLSACCDESILSENRSS